MLISRKQSQCCIFWGKDKDERIQNWFKHFKLLGQEPVIEDENKVIREIFHDLVFQTGEFTMEEYKKAKE